MASMRVSAVLVASAHGQRSGSRRRCCRPLCTGRPGTVNTVRRSVAALAFEVVAGELTDGAAEVVRHDGCCASRWMSTTASLGVHMTVRVCDLRIVFVRVMTVRTNWRAMSVGARVAFW
jgi:hypothetical protein